MQKLEDAKISHCKLSGDMSFKEAKDLIESIGNNVYRAVFMTPEIIFNGEKASTLIQDAWRKGSWRKQMRAIVIDEVHCVDKWGSDFRVEYAMLGRLRAFAPIVPLVGVTATILDEALRRTLLTLVIPDAVVIRVKEVRVNIRLELRTQPKNDPEKSLTKLLSKDKSEKTIVYFEKISTLIRVRRIVKQLRPELELSIGSYHSTLHSDYKRLLMKYFQSGKIHILFATEAAGMGCDIPNVIQVIQYGDMPSMVQRFGRAVRDGITQGYGILLAPAMTKNFPIDDNIRNYVMAGNVDNQGVCRWCLIDSIFRMESPDRTNCCDACQKVKSHENPATTIVLPVAIKLRGPKRTEAEKSLAEQRLRTWRKDAWRRYMEQNSLMFGYENQLLSENALKILAQRFSQVVTVKEVEAMADTHDWIELDIEPGVSNFAEIAQVLVELNEEIEENKETPEQLNNNFHNDQEEGNNENV
ncbi:hypothetical protein BGZ82_001318 [Podila clonocystis]|nr:hypothetical protein BGZ82_001318 [Podila clonocystis]